MRYFEAGICVLVLTSVLGPANSGDDAGKRSPGVILGEIDALKREDGDPAREVEPGYVQEFWRREHDRLMRRAGLIAELYRVDPGNPRVVTLLPARWRALSGRLMGADGTEDVPALLVEVGAVAARTPDPALRVEAAYLIAWIASDPRDRPGAAAGFAAKARAVDNFLAFAPADARGGELLYQLSLGIRNDPARQDELYRRIVRDYPATKMADVARGLLARREATGKPFDLAFRDATTGAAVATADWRGKVIVVDFWATWCGPCIADLPRLQDLYRRYHDRGVEFVGVALEYPVPDGDPDKFRAFVAHRQIPWPQDYQADGLDVELATRWGIRAIPALFVVDRAGRIVTTDAGDRLEPILLDLLAP